MSLIFHINCPLLYCHPWPVTLVQQPPLTIILSFKLSCVITIIEARQLSSQPRKLSLPLALALMVYNVMMSFAYCCRGAVAKVIVLSQAETEITKDKGNVLLLSCNVRRLLRESLHWKEETSEICQLCVLFLMLIMCWSTNESVATDHWSLQSSYHHH